MLKPHRRGSALYAVALTAVLTATPVLAGCDSGGGDESAGGGPSVIAPGRPGEAASTLSAGQAAKARPDDTPNQADLGYVARMIEHHRQALVMTDLAGEHAESASVRALAGRIAAAQGPEIETMRAWLKTNGGSEHDGHGGSAMPGMATAAQLADLRAARGAAFDRLFLRLMIAHHQGAVTMATEVLGKGNNVQVEEWANEVIAQQSAEIGRMRALR